MKAIQGSIRTNANGYLEAVSDSSHVLYCFKCKLFHFADDDQYLMIAVPNGRWTTLLKNIYAQCDRGRVSEQCLSSGDVFRYRYTYVGQHITQTIVEVPWARGLSLFGEAAPSKE